MKQILSTRCDPIVLQQIKQAAQSEDTSLREIIERAWKFYHKELMRKEIIESYSTLDQQDVAIAEEDMSTYFSDVINDEL